MALTIDSVQRDGDDLLVAIRLPVGDVPVAGASDAIRARLLRSLLIDHGPVEVTRRLAQYLTPTQISQLAMRIAAVRQQSNRIEGMPE